MDLLLISLHHSVILLQLLELVARGAELALRVDAAQTPQLLSVTAQCVKAPTA